VSTIHKLTSRAHLASTLAQEILNNPKSSDFAIASEHQLCRRFNISRVTVRLALADLERRGLIYRRHGKGTFAFGNASRIHKAVGILLKSSAALEYSPITEMVRGVQSFLAPSGISVMFINTSPEQWSPDLAGHLGGVLVFPQGIVDRDLDVLRNRKLPFFLAGETALSGAQIQFGQTAAGQLMTEKLLLFGHQRIALLSGCEPSLDAPKREGIHRALRSAGIDPAQTPEFSAQGQESDKLKAVSELLNMPLLPTAVIAFDDSLASLLGFHARRTKGIKIPEDLSIISFHDSPYLRYTEPSHTTVRFDFFEAGRQAAEILSQVAMTGETLGDLLYKPTYCAGQTLASPRSAARAAITNHAQQSRSAQAAALFPS
jgi:DNA-binding LacI/PurR family transcriptional regulator